MIQSSLIQDVEVEKVMNEKELIHVKSMCRFFFCLCLDKIKTRFLLSQGYILIS